MLIYFHLTPSDQYLLSHRDVVKHSFFLSFICFAGFRWKRKSSIMFCIMYCYSDPLRRYLEPNITRDKLIPKLCVVNGLFWIMKIFLEVTGNIVYVKMMLLVMNINIHLNAIYFRKER